MCCVWADAEDAETKIHKINSLINLFIAIIVLSLILYKDRCLIVKIQHNGRLIVINCKEIFMLSKLVEYALYVHIYAINVDFY